MLPHQVRPWLPIDNKRKGVYTLLSLSLDVRLQELIVIYPKVDVRSQPQGWSYLYAAATQEPYLCT
jgi:hypothetical protein